MTTTACPARDGSPSADQCGAPAVAIVTFGCVHEHRASGVLCTGHLMSLEAAHCRLCAISGRPHECPLALVDVQPTDGGEGGVGCGTLESPHPAHLPAQDAHIAGWPGEVGGERGPGSRDHGAPNLPLGGTRRVGMMSDPRQDGSVGGRPQPGRGTLSPRHEGKGGPASGPGGAASPTPDRRSLPTRPRSGQGPPRPALLTEESP